MTADPPITAVAFLIEPPPPDAAALEGRFTPDQIGVLEKLNRRTRRYLPRAEQIAIPQTWFESHLAYSPFPMGYAWAARHPKALVVHLPSQAFGAYEQGRLVRWGPVSSGREDLPTPSGLFHLNWKSRGRHSTVDPDWYMPWYFNFHNERGLSLHEYVLPGVPASHACVRLLERDAQWLFDWGEEWTLDEKGWNVLDPGTPLLILGRYDFDAPPPWLSPEWLAHGISLPSDPVPAEAPGTTAGETARGPG